MIGLAVVNAASVGTDYIVHSSFGTVSIKRPHFACVAPSLQGGILPVVVTRSRVRSLPASPLTDIRCAFFGFVLPSGVLTFLGLARWRAPYIVGCRLVCPLDGRLAHRIPQDPVRLLASQIQKQRDRYRAPLCVRLFCVHFGNGRDRGLDSCGPVLVFPIRRVCDCPLVSISPLAKANGRQGLAADIRRAASDNG